MVADLIIGQISSFVREPGASCDTFKTKAIAKATSRFIVIVRLALLAHRSAGVSWFSLADVLCYGSQK